uniref:Mandelate racemase/muconate lactonizing enzyme, C-terminal domain protein n=1 Tax=Solibacter usitatus (strain Ellin6076) TaxID=234267 RepID=Q01NB7_SOLUE
MPGPLNPQLEMVALDAFAVREPASRRAYTILRLRTRSGAQGYGECSRISRADLTALRGAIQGREASNFETVRRGISLSPALAGLEMAMLDALGIFANAPVYQVLGGPTRNRARALARIQGDTDELVAASVVRARAGGHQAFMIPVPRTGAPNHSATLVAATQQRLAAVRSAAGEGADFVLDAGAALTPGDASSIAAAFERAHLLWFDEPCRISNLTAAYRIAVENVTPIGFGRFADEAGVFQDLLRGDAIDVIRADIARQGITRIRRIAALAETYYVAVAPFHDGGPIATAAALHLAASLPNFFIQQLPTPFAEQDRDMRARLAGNSIEAVKDGFLELPRGPGLGVRVNEAALNEYREVEG